MAKDGDFITRRVVHWVYGLDNNGRGVNNVTQSTYFTRWWQRGRRMTRGAPL